MLGDSSIGGEVALGEADTSSSSISAQSAIAEFSWSVSAVASFSWEGSAGVATFSWET